MSKRIPLTQGRVAIVDETDFEWLSQWKWYWLRQRWGVGYAIRRIQKHGKRTSLRMHRQILVAPVGVQIDHRNMNGLDNRRCNLRLCTRSQNNVNSAKRAGCSSIFKGVSWRPVRRKWRAYIGFGGQWRHLGHFDDEREAARAYNQAAIKYYGEFARLNPVGERHETHAHRGCSSRV